MQRVLMKTLGKLISLLFPIFLFIPLEAVGENDSPGGLWEGTLAVPEHPQRIILDLSHMQDDEWAGYISIPEQGIIRQSLSNIQFSDRRISLNLPIPVGHATFSGRVSEDGKVLEGTFTQADRNYTFKVQRIDDPTIRAKMALEGFEEFVAAAIKDWNVPGLAMAIISDGQVVFAQGFGRRNLEQDLPVTPKTLFAVASNTKAFTTFTLGTLVDEGKMAWDTPLREYIPEFRLDDPIASDVLTPRDLVIHHTGVPSNDLIWYNEEFSREELVRRLQFLDASAPVHTKFQYTNIMYIAAGYLIEQLTGQSYEDAVRERIFKPIGMERSTFSLEAARQSGDLATPYLEKIEMIEEYKYRQVELWAPAGGLYTNLEDMTQWLLTHLNSGKSGDKQVIDSATIAEIHTPQVFVTSSTDHPAISPHLYAHGWNVDSYRGHRRLFHGGTIDGFHSRVMMFPDDGIGTIVLTNKTRTGLPEVVSRHAADRLLGLEPIDWNSRDLEKRHKVKEKEREAETKKKARKHGTKPAHNLAEYAGEYENPGYGLARVNIVDNRLEFVYNGIITPLQHWHYEVFLAAEDPEDDLLAQEVFTFRTDIKGNVCALESPFEPRVGTIIFTKKPDAKLSDPEFLRRFTGTYDLEDQIITIELSEDVLTMKFPKEAVATLVPALGEEFTLKNSSWDSVTFSTDKRDNVTGLVLQKRGRLYPASRRK